VKQKDLPAGAGSFAPTLTGINSKPMKKFIPVILLLFLPIKFYCQEFAPIGAEWYYHEGYAFSGDINYIKFSSEKDTLIQGEICKKITKRRKLMCNDRPFVEYIFTRNDTVFFLDTIFNEFQILYNFGAEVNTNWIIKTKDEGQEEDTILVFVDSISYTQINDWDLKTLHVTYEKLDEYSPYEFSSIIIERIGDPMYMFNWTHLSQIACDINWTRGLRCYYDDELGLYSTGMADSCNYTFKWTQIESLPVKSTFTVFPNPTSGKVTIKCFDNKPIVIELKNLMGETLLIRKNMVNKVIDLTNYPSGVYFILGKVDNKYLKPIQIVKY
jgi:hypothetical protein